MSLENIATFAAQLIVAAVWDVYDAALCAIERGAEAVGQWAEAVDGRLADRINPEDEK